MYNRPKYRKMLAQTDNMFRKRKSISCMSVFHEKIVSFVNHCLVKEIFGFFVCSFGNGCIYGFQMARTPNLCPVKPRETVQIQINSRS